MSFSSLIEGITPKIRILCFCPDRQRSLEPFMRLQVEFRSLTAFIYMWLKASVNIRSVLILEMRCVWMKFRLFYTNISHVDPPRGGVNTAAASSLPPTPPSIISCLSMDQSQKHSQRRTRRVTRSKASWHVQKWQSMNLLFDLVTHRSLANPKWVQVNTVPDLAVNFVTHHDLAISWRMAHARSS